MVSTTLDALELEFKSQESFQLLIVIYFCELIVTELEADLGSCSDRQLINEHLISGGFV